MSGYLWKYYLEDDVENFRRVLETAGYTTRGGAAQKGHASRSDNVGLGVGSPGSFATSPTFVVKSRREQDSSSGGLTLTRADLNYRDSWGRTLLHLAAASSSENAHAFALALLEHPLTDIYIQDTENMWTALHRAFYAGNVSIAHSIMVRDVQDASGHGSGTLHHMAGGLIKMKDREGNGPFDLLEMTLEGKMSEASHVQRTGDGVDDSDNESMPGNGDEERTGSLISYPSLHGDEMFTFGSNQNITLGFGDEDDRTNPERITLRRPDHLYFHAYQDYVSSSTNSSIGIAPGSDLSKSGNLQPVFVSELPSVLRNKPICIQDVQMGKLHTAVLTDDAESNLHVCGHGQGGRLGLGDERTRFQFACVDGGAIANKKIASVALGQNHTIALSDQGEVFTWGNNGCGQLGYELPKTAVRDEDSIQTTPRRIFGPLKREIITGVTASRIHSVAYNGMALYTWGKNEGQLGIVHSESRSVKIQAAPRNVAASRFSSQISSVSAIDRATSVLLDSHEVIVFAHFVYIKIDFPLHGFDNYFLKSSFMTTKYDRSPNRVCKIVSGGDIICAMTSSGQVFTVSVSEPPALQNNDASTTNPKLGARNALSNPVRVWSNKKSHLSARDIDIDQNGSIILATQVGSVWRRTRRAIIKDATAAGIGDKKPKDYKYSRIPGLTRVAAVRASGFGAYAAIREDCSKMRDDIPISASTLLSDIWPLVPYETVQTSHGSGTGPPKRDLIDAVLKTEDPDELIASIVRPRKASVLPYDLLLCSTTSDVEVPVHQCIISARSKIIRTALEELGMFEHFSIPDVLSLKKSDDGIIRIVFAGIDTLTLFNLGLYIYTDSLATVWSSRSDKQQLAFRYRQSRLELLKIAARLEMSYLESVLKRIVLPISTLAKDMESAYADPAFFANADVVVQLAGGEEAWVHGAIVCQRCPFFEGLFQGRTGGQWLAVRRQNLTDPDDAIRVDLTDIQLHVFQRVLQHIYAGTGPELFDDVVEDGLDEFLDLVIDVMSAANELMLERLSEICQHVVGRYVTTRNVCQLLNAIAPCSISIFKEKALEYICYNLEAIIQHGHMEALDEDLLEELDETARRLQSDCSIIARTGRYDEILKERHPDLEKRIKQERQAKIDSIVLFNKYNENDGRVPASFRAGSFHDFNETSKLPATRRKSSALVPGLPSPQSTPILQGKSSTADLMFEMDGDEEDENNVPLSSFKAKLNTAGITPSPSSQEKPAIISAWAANAVSPQPLGSSVDEPQSLPKTPGRPWGTTPLAASKLGMKDIMEQASASRTSALSIGLSESTYSGQEARVGSFGGKISQRDRKKIQQAQLGMKSESVIATTSSLATTTSPWQIKRKEATRSTSNTQVVPDTDSTSRPQLTMRQTIANPSSSGVDKEMMSVNATAAASSPKTNQPTRTTSSKSTPKKPVSSNLTADSPGFAISERPVAIQSVRHVPQRERNLHAEQRNLIDILSEQEIQKQEIRDFAAKRSLAEIQQEQEFQAWWDKESARLREEEEEAATKVGETVGAKKGSSGRGQRRRGRGGGNAKPKSDPSSEVPPKKKIGRSRARPSEKGDATTPAVAAADVKPTGRIQRVHGERKTAV